MRPAAATLGRGSPSTCIDTRRIDHGDALVASCARAANSLSQITIPIRWVLSAAANDSVRKSVLSITTSAPTIAVANTASKKPRPLRHKTPTAWPGPAPRRCNSLAREFRSGTAIRGS